MEMKNFKKQKSFILCLAHPVLWVGPKSEFCILSDPPITGGVGGLGGAGGKWNMRNKLGRKEK